jgi:hypothetical protein
MLRNTPKEKQLIQLVDYILLAGDRPDVGSALFYILLLAGIS